MVTLTRTTRGTSNFDYGDTMIDTDNLVGNELTSKGGTFSPSAERTFVTGLALISQRLTRCLKRGGGRWRREREERRVERAVWIRCIRNQGRRNNSSFGRKARKRKEAGAVKRRGEERRGEDDRVEVRRKRWWIKGRGQSKLRDEKRRWSWLVNGRDRERERERRIRI